MNGTNVDLKENNGNLYIGNQKFYNIICHCGADCHNHDNTFQETSSTSAAERAIQHFPSSVNDTNLAVLSDAHAQVTDTRLCLCAVYTQGDKIVMESSVSKIVTDFIHDKNCTHFEVQLKLKQICQICQGNNRTTTYASQEFECTLASPLRDLGKNIPLELNRVPNCQPEPQTPFQAFLEESRNLIDAEGNFIRIITEICENGKRVRIKLRFDVRSSVVRRVKSFSDFDSITSTENLNGFGKRMSSTSLGPGKAQSRITILDGVVDIQETDKSEGLATLDMQDTYLENADDQVDLVDGLNVNELENREPFATGKFGSLYKVSHEGRDQLVKIVITNQENKKFLEEASLFRKCRHPYIRPTANILEYEERSLVFYWFLNGQSLFEALEENAITNYVIFCRILYGIVNGLVYLRRKGIRCQYLTPEKVLLDINFNPRISGVGTAYFECSEHPETSDGNFHRSLSYLDLSLRSKREQHPKNILWSVGRCTWDMLFGKICQDPEPDNFLSKYIIRYLDEPCDDHKIRSSYFRQELRTIVFGAGWPKDKEITKSLVVCAFRCMLLNLEERMSLKELHSTLKTELCDLQKKVKFGFYKALPSDKLCLYCIENERDNLPLTCGCVTACTDCLRNNGQLECPEHGLHYSKIGHPLTYGVIIQGDFNGNKSICENDSDTIESLLKDQSIFAIKNIESVKSKSEKEARHELKRIRMKIMVDEKAKHSEIYPRTVLLYINGHCNKAGNLILPDGSTLKKKVLSEFISETNPKNLIVLANGHYSEQLVKNLSGLKTKNNFFASRKFFGVFSHGGNLCEISDRELSADNSILVTFVLDILKKDQRGGQFSSEANRRYLTAAGLADEISNRMRRMYSKCLKPVNQDGGHIPITYVNCNM